MLMVKETDEKFFADRGIELVVKKMPMAVETYNELVSSGARVAALIHTTC